MLRLRLAAAAAAVTCALDAGGATAKPAELQGLVAADRPAGCGEVSLLFWDLYRAELWSDAVPPPGTRYAVSLSYRLDFTRDELVDSTIEEMARISGRPQAAFETLRPTFQTAFRDVSEGDRFTAWRAGDSELQFFLNGRPTGVLTERVDLFLSIWLGEKSRAPDAREAMLAGRCDG